MIAHIEKLLTQALKELGYEYPAETIISEPPSHIAADFAVNSALQVAKAAGKNPREIAEQLQEKLMATGHFSTIEIAGPGFLNLQLNDSLYREAFVSLQRGDIIQKSDPKKVVVEYISANPTGPMHIGNSRGGPIGETISRVLEAQGHIVARDFYWNDIGGQVKIFALSVLHHYKTHFNVASEFPEKGYPAPYVEKLAHEIVKTEGDRLIHLPEEEQIEAMRVLVMDGMLTQVQKTCERMGIHFDTFSKQSTLVESGRSAEALEILKQRDSVLSRDGALWLKSGLQDDDRETVLVKSDGTGTYFLDDIAFYRMKLEEWGNDFGICVLGANHFGHIPRMRAGMAGIGIDPERYQGVMYQYVQLKEDGETKRMAKREGTFVTADEVLDEIPRDVFTWFMLSKTADTHLDFDLKLAKDSSEKNPIYYVQYAHARIHSVLAKAGDPAEMGNEPAFNREERALLRHLSNFGGVVQEVAETYRTHLIPTYLYELATRYHHFYAHHRVMTDDSQVGAARIMLSQFTAKVLKDGLHLLNIEAQERM